MVDLAKETPIDVAGVQRRFKVSHRTVYRWFGRGLERVKVGGAVYTSLEAIQRFGDHSESACESRASEVKAALKELRDRYGITVEGLTDGRKEAGEEVSHLSLQGEVTRSV